MLPVSYRLLDPELWGFLYLFPSLPLSLALLLPSSSFYPQSKEEIINTKCIKTQINIESFFVKHI